MSLTTRELFYNKIDNQSTEIDKQQLKQYYYLFGELNPIYNKCGNCIYEDEYGCWKDECIRNKMNLHCIGDGVDLRKEK